MTNLKNNQPTNQKEVKETKQLSPLELMLLNAKNEVKQKSSFGQTVSKYNYKNICDLLGLNYEYEAKNDFKIVRRKFRNEIQKFINRTLQNIALQSNEAEVKKCLIQINESAKLFCNSYFGANYNFANIREFKSDLKEQIYFNDIKRINAFYEVVKVENIYFKK